MASELRDRSLSDSITKIRVGLTGAKGVGKTSIAQRYVNKGFRDCNKKSSNGLYLKRVGRFEIEVLDFCEEKICPIQHLPSCDAYILVYAIDDDTSFDYLSILREKIILEKGERVPIIVAGNKSDLSIRKVHKIMADCVVNIDWENIYCEVSAKTNHNIDQLFQQLISLPHFRKNSTESDKKLQFFKRSSSVSFILELRKNLPVSKLTVMEKERSSNQSIKKNGVGSRLFKFLRTNSDTSHV